ncbi:MAG: hypothetical protein ACYSVY_01060 [Planctomycetota bacterium]
MNEKDKRAPQDGDREILTAYGAVIEAVECGDRAAEKRAKVRLEQLEGRKGVGKTGKSERCVSGVGTLKR